MSDYKLSNIIKLFIHLYTGKPDSVISLAIDPYDTNIFVDTYITVTRTFHEHCISYTK